METEATASCGGTLQRSAGDLIPLQQQISAPHRISFRRGRGPPRYAGATQPKNPEAYDLYLGRRRLPRSRPTRK